MNNTYSENPYYYGKAFMTGITKIKYDSINDLSIKVNAKTAKNTDLFIPIYGDQEVVLHDFISFKQIDSSKENSFVPKVYSKDKLAEISFLEILKQRPLLMILIRSLDFDFLALNITVDCVTPSNKLASSLKYTIVDKS